MNPWADLHRAHEAMRQRPVDITGEIRRRLIELSDAGHCSASIRGRLTYQNSSDKRLRRLHIRPEAGATEGEPLTLPGMESAHLQVQAVLDTRDHAVHAFSAHLWGRTRAGLGWALAVHLDDDLAPATQDLQSGQKGGGACGHAVFHCHVGPDLDAEPKVRVPLPAVGPEHVLDWLLATVVPGFEPMPWPKVNEMIEKVTP